MIKKPLVSLVIVTYNSSNNIGKLLNSISNLNTSQYIDKLVIIENNSPDKEKTRQVINSYRVKTQTNITYISSSTNNGFGKSCNIGTLNIKSKYVLFINPDTELNRDSLKVLINHAEQNNSDIIGGKSEDYKGNRHLTVVRKPNLNIGLFEFSNLGKIFGTKRGHNDFYYLDSKAVTNAKDDVIVDGLGGAYLMFKLNAFKKLQGFDERFFMYLEDVDISIRAKMLGMSVMYCPHSTIKHIGGASSNNKYKIRHQAWYDSRKYYFRKHFGFLTNLILQPLYTIEEYLLKLRSNK